MGVGFRVWALGFGGLRFGLKSLGASAAETLQKKNEHSREKYRAIIVTTSNPKPQAPSPKP